MADKKAELMAAIKKMRDDLEWLQARLDLNIFSPEQVGNKLRNKSIELGVIACMPFREGERGSESVSCSCPHCGAFNAERPDLSNPDLTRCASCGRSYSS